MQTTHKRRWHKTIAKNTTPSMSGTWPNTSTKQINLSCVLTYRTYTVVRAHLSNKILNPSRFIPEKHTARLKQKHHAQKRAPN